MKQGQAFGQIESADAFPGVEGKWELFIYHEDIQLATLPT